MSDGTQHPRCPFYPESCLVERHANMAHRWREAVVGKDVARKVLGRPVLHVAHKLITNADNEQITNAPRITNKAPPPGDAGSPVTEAGKRVQGPQRMGAAELVPRSEVERQEAIKAARRLRARTWNQANRETYNARQRERMAKVRGEKMAAKKA